MNRGKLTIFTIVAVALSAASFAWWYHWKHLGRALEFWGTDAARLIRYGENAELWILKPDLEADSRVDRAIPGFAVAQTIPLTKKRGLIHARQAMIEDISFAWDDNSTVDGRWQYALRFWDKDQSPATVLIDLDSRQIRIVEANRQQTMADRLSDGLSEYLKIILDLEGAS